MTKAFKNNRKSHELTIDKYGGKLLSVALGEIGEAPRSRHHFDPSIAPALALAILEAAGLVRDSCSGDDAEVALEWLHAAVARREHEAKKAADREALEAEAETLFMARMKSHLEPLSFKPFSEQPDKYRGEWVKVAIAARELHKAKS